MNNATSARTGARGPARSLALGLCIAALSALGVGGVVWYQASVDREEARQDLDRRAALLVHRNASAARAALALPDDRAGELMGDRLEGHSRLLGLGLVRPDGRLVAGPAALADHAALLGPLVRDAIAQGEQRGTLQRSPALLAHAWAAPVLAVDDSPAGALVVVHDASYLDERLTGALVRGLALALAVAAALLVVVSGLAWALFERPMLALADWMRRLRFGTGPESPPRNIPVRRLADESAHLAASFRAARSNELASADERLRSENLWTRERLRAHALAALGDRTLVVVSNREPYMHQMKDGVAMCVTPASGLVTGLDPVLRACGGLWVAHGAGDADRQTADASGCIPVPPDDPRYTLRRVWITKEEEQGYYYGFSNEGLWPLCHLTHERPTFRASDWEQYVRANQRFADAVLDELGDTPAVVLVQDYQLALVPGMLKARRPDLRVGLFWHIPWPNPEAFRICPFRVELLRGMLGSDLLGFHLQQHCNNFLDTVDRMVEARLDWDHFAAELQGRSTLVRPFPISVQPWSERPIPSPEEFERLATQARQRHGLGDVELAVGVDRIDYTKGIAERFRAVERFFEANPQHLGRLTFVQLGAPSRTHIPRYRDLVAELESLADAINWRFARDGSDWKPIRLLVAHHDATTVYTFMRMARVGVVSSLHDGMNLVAKEFVAAHGEPRPDGSTGDGVLILSEFAGAARDLADALIINPYDTEQFAQALRTAVEMPLPERQARLARMHRQVADHNIYRWAADFITSLTRVPAADATPPPPTSPSPPSSSGQPAIIVTVGPSGSARGTPTGSAS